MPEVSTRRSPNRHRARGCCGPTGTRAKKDLRAGAPANPHRRTHAGVARPHPGPAPQRGRLDHRGGRRGPPAREGLEARPRDRRGRAEGHDGDRLHARPARGPRAPPPPPARALRAGLRARPRPRVRVRRRRLPARALLLAGARSAGERAPAPQARRRAATSRACAASATASRCRAARERRNAARERHPGSRLRSTKTGGLTAPGARRESSQRSHGTDPFAR